MFVCFFFKTDSSSFSDKKPRERKPEPAPERKRVTSSVLKRNNSIKKAMRPDIEQTFVSKLEKLGVKSVSSRGSVSEKMFCVLGKKKRSPIAASLPRLLQGQDGLRSRELSSLLSRVGSERGSVAKGMPDFWHVREELARSLEQRLSSERRDGRPAAESLSRTRPPAQGRRARYGVIVKSDLGHTQSLSGNNVE